MRRALIRQICLWVGSWVFQVSAVSGCAGGAQAKPGPASRPVPPAMAEAGAAFLASCKETCERAQMARAVSAQMIERQCETSCSEDWQLPVCLERADVMASADKRVRVFGKLIAVDPAIAERGGPAGSLQLADGLVLQLSSGPAIMSSGALVAFETKTVIVVATLRPGSAPSADGGGVDAKALAHLDLVTTVVGL